MVRSTHGKVILVSVPGREIHFRTDTPRAIRGYAMRRDIVDLRERMAKLEGSVDVLSKFLIDRERRSGREATT